MPKYCPCGSVIPEYRFACDRCADHIHKWNDLIRERDAEILEMEFFLAERGIFRSPEAE